MSIDWITVAAQIANFLVLIWLLKRFLYRPILNGIEAREVEITDRMQVAVRAQEKADAAESSYRDQLSALQFEQSEITDTMRHKAEEQRDALLAEAHDRLEQERKNWEAHLSEEGRKYTAKLHRAGAGALLSLTRKALIDLADETLEGRMAHHLATQMKSMSSDLHHAAGRSTEAIVTSHAPLPTSVQDQMTTDVQAVFPKIPVRFETDADQSPGLVLRVGGAQLAWTVDSYIDGLNTLMEEQLAAGTDPKAQSYEH